MESSALTFKALQKGMSKHRKNAGDRLALLSQFQFEEVNGELAAKGRPLLVEGQLYLHTSVPFTPFILQGQVVQGIA